MIAKCFDILDPNYIFFYLEKYIRKYLSNVLDVCRTIHSCFSIQLTKSVALNGLVSFKADTLHLLTCFPEAFCERLSRRLHHDSPAIEPTNVFPNACTTFCCLRLFISYDFCVRVLQPEKLQLSSSMEAE